MQAHKHFTTDVPKLRLQSRMHVAMSPNGRFVLSAGGFEENWKLWEAADGAEWMAGAKVPTEPERASARWTS